MNYPIQALFVLGKYGAGKTDFTQFLKTRLPQEESIRVPLNFSSDRIFIEEEVIRDVLSAGAPEKGRVGVYSTLYKPHAESGSREFGVKDGTLHGIAHRAMVQSIRHKSQPSLQVLEIGIGPDVEITKGKPLLRQSGEHFLKLFHDECITEHILVIEMEAPFDIRSQRNKERKNPVPDDIFAVAATDAGEFWKIRHGLGDRYILFRNETNDRDIFLREAEKIVAERIVPYIRGEGGKISPEGRTQEPFRLER